MFNGKLYFKHVLFSPLFFTSGPSVSLLARQNEGTESKFMVQTMMKLTGLDKPVIVEITRAIDVQVCYSL